MARPSMAARSFSQTEELERLEQSITLTLQEIDHNFSKAHRIVTTSILPVVEQYGENSKAIWEASKFWKQFFEASANVSLSGYEELANDESTIVEESTAMRDDDNTADQRQDTPSRNYDNSRALDRDDDEDDEFMLDDAELAVSTPRPLSKTGQTRKTPMRRAQGDEEDESPYEAMRREMKSEEDYRDETTVLQDGEDSSVLFAQQTARLPDVTLTPKALLDQRNRDPATGGRDPLLHRVLDKNYRIQATPHRMAAARGTPVRGGDGAKASLTGKQRQVWQDLSEVASSSPEMAIPQLRSEAFMSPYKSSARTTTSTAAAGRRMAPPPPPTAMATPSWQGPRTPGVSVQTPMSRKTRQALAEGSLRGKQKYEIEWESEEDDDEDLYGGMSPPKTIQFALPPSKLLQTPAREASKRIVDDILTDAGANPASSEYSPTLVKMNEDILNDSF